MNQIDPPLDRSWVRSWPIRLIASHTAHGRTTFVGPQGLCLQT